MAITFPNVIKATGNGVTTVTTTGTTTTTGSTFVVTCSNGVSFGGTPNTPTDSKSNTYTLAGLATFNSINATAWYCQNGTGGASHTATVTFGGTDYPVVHLIELAGAATSSADTPTINTSGSLNGPFSISTSSTLAQADSAIISWVGCGDGGTQSYAASGYSVSSETDGNTYFSGAVGYKTVSSTATASITWTGLTNTVSYGIMAFKAASAGGSAITPAAGVATTSTLTGKSTAASTLTAAAGIATTSTMVGSSTDRASFTSASGIATTSTMASRATVASAFTSAAGLATTSTMVGASTAAASLSGASGLAVTSTLTASALAAAAFVAAAGQATTSTLIAFGASVITPAVGIATTFTLASTVSAVASFLPASGIATTATMIGSDASGGGTSGGIFRPTYRPRRR